MLLLTEALPATPTTLVLELKNALSVAAVPSSASHAKQNYETQHLLTHTACMHEKLHGKGETNACN